MRDKTLNDVKDNNVKGHLQFIYENAEDNEVKDVDDVPTTDTLRPQDAPVRKGTDLYYNINGTIYKVGLTAI